MSVVCIVMPIEAIEQLKTRLNQAKGLTKKDEDPPPAAPKPTDKYGEAIRKFKEQDEAKAAAAATPAPQPTPASEPRKGRKWTEHDYKLRGLKLPKDRPVTVTFTAKVAPETARAMHKLAIDGECTVGQALDRLLST